MARYLPQAKLLIQHIPRTGGTWIEDALGICQIKAVKWVQKQPIWLPRKHSLLSHYWRSQLKNIQYVAAFVRHPVPYYASVWRWLRMSEVRKLKLRPGRSAAKRLLSDWTWHPHRTAAIQWLETGGLEGTFNDWVFLMLETEPLWYTRIIEQFVGPPGGEFCDYIGRTETLTDDFLMLLKMFGYQVDELQVRSMEKKNVSKEPIEWEPSLKARVEDTERLVIKRFYGEDLQRRIYARLAKEGLASMAS